MKLTKHWHYLVTLIGLFIVSYVLGIMFAESPAILMIKSSVVVVGYIVVIIAWIIFAINQSKKDKKIKEEKGEK